MFSDITADRLADPPGGIGAEFEATRGIKFRDSAQKPRLPSWIKIQERNTTPKIPFGNTHHQAQVGADERLVGFFSPAIDRLQSRFSGYYLPGKRRLNQAASGITASSAQLFEQGYRYVIRQ